MPPLTRPSPTHQAALDKDKAMDLLNTGLTRVGGAIASLLTNRDQMLGMVGLTAGVAISVYSAKEGFALARTRLEAILGRPTLVRQTSRNATIFERARALITPKNEEELIKGVVLAPKIEQRVRSLSEIVKSQKKAGAEFRHIMYVFYVSEGVPVDSRFHPFVADHSRVTLPPSSPAPPPDPRPLKVLGPSRHGQDPRRTQARATVGPGLRHHERR